MWYCSTTRAIEVPGLTPASCSAIKADMTKLQNEGTKQNRKTPVYSITCVEAK
jgi:hypothetical protein